MHFNIKKKEFDKYVRTVYKIRSSFNIKIINGTLNSELRTQVELKFIIYFGKQPSSKNCYQH